MNKPEDVVRGITDFTTSFKQAVEERNSAEARAESFERTSAILTGENESLRMRLKEVEAKLGYYMRHSNEITTHLDNGLKLFHDALEKSKIGAYRPNGQGRIEPPEPPLPASTPVPKFLTSPRDNEALARLEQELSGALPTPRV